MDSMRSLNTSLPASSSNASASQPPEQLLQAFKTAALSVTNLYKTAATDQANARHAGYQDALEDILAFLEKERLGTDGGGEAAKIRSWVTDRIDGTGQTTGDSDEERADNDKRTRSSSPMVVRKGSPDASHPRQHSPQSQTPTPTTTSTTTTNESGTCVRQPNFTFTAEPQYPGAGRGSGSLEDVDMPPSDATRSSSPGNPHITPSPNTTSPSLRVELIPRAGRTPHRSNNVPRHGPRPSPRDPIAGAGSKRKFHFGDFFDISNFGNGRDSIGGGKRGRFT